MIGNDDFNTLMAVGRAAGQSINWAASAVTAATSVLVSVTIAWLTFQLVKRREMAATLRLEVEKLELVKKPELAETLRTEIASHREMLRLEQEKDKDERIRVEVLRWANPILGTVEDLRGRLDNILYQQGYVVLDPNYRETPEWSISHAYFMHSTLYLFGAYFAYAQALRDSLSFELFRDQQDKQDLFEALALVGTALSIFPPPYRCSGGDRQVFHLEQRSMGDILLREDDRSRCISYTDFLDRLSEGTFSAIFLPLQKLLQGLEPAPNDCRWKRLDSVHKALAKVDAPVARSYIWPMGEYIMPSVFPICFPGITDIGDSDADRAECVLSNRVGSR